MWARVIAVMPAAAKRATHAYARLGLIRINAFDQALVNLRQGMK